MSKQFKDLVKSTFEEQLVNVHFGRSLTLKKQVETFDDEGYLTDVSETESTITGVLIPINDENKTFFDIGRYNQGDAYGYFQEGDSVEEDNIIAVDDTEYEVTKILSKADGINGESCFTATYCKVRNR